MVLQKNYHDEQGVILKLKHLLSIFVILIFTIRLAAEIDIFLTSSNTDLTIGEPLQVDVEITGMTEDMRAYAITVEYDTCYFTASTDDFREGTFLSSSGDHTQWEMSGTDGSYTATCSILGYTAGVSGSGILFSFELTNLGQTTTETTVSITNVVLRDVLNNEIEPVNVAGLTVSITAVYLNVQILLEGAWNGGTSMRYDLETTGNIPLVSPFDGETLAALPDVSPQNIVDWIRLELRETSGGSSVDVCNAFLLDNADLVSTAGDNAFAFPDADENNYYLIIRHRNHLDIMTADSYLLSNEHLNPTVIDLTDDSNVYGNLAVKELTTGIYGMISGDADQDGQIASTDLNQNWRTETGTGGYLSADFDLSSEVQSSDRNDFWRINSGASTKIP